MCNILWFPTLPGSGKVKMKKHTSYLARQVVHKIHMKNSFL